MSLGKRRWTAPLQSGSASGASALRCNAESPHRVTGDDGGCGVSHPTRGPRETVVQAGERRPGHGPRLLPGFKSTRALWLGLIALEDSVKTILEYLENSGKRPQPEWSSERPVASNEQREGRPEAGCWEARPAETGPACPELSITTPGGAGRGCGQAQGGLAKSTWREARGTAFQQGAASQAVNPATLDRARGWELGAGSWVGGAFPGSGCGGAARG